MQINRVKDLSVGDQFIMCGCAFRVYDISDGRLKYKTIGGNTPSEISANSNLMIEIIRQVPVRTVENSLSELVEMFSKDPEVTFKTFSSIIAKEFFVNPEDLRSKNRRIPIVEARSAAMYLFTKYTLFDHETISIEFNMDRTSVTNAVKRAKKLLENSRDFRDSIQHITAKLKSKAA